VIIYLTYNDPPTGVYWSQVTDVVAHLNTLDAGRVRLVALVSPRGFRATRRAIRQRMPDAWVLPMVPGVRNWRANARWVAMLCRLLRPTGIMARGVLATWMALRARERGLLKRVAFDGRGAYAAEWEEYRIVDDDALIAGFRPLEQEAVRDSDFRLAVSQALVDHWRERYGYQGDRHVVVPCTLGHDLLGEAPAMEDHALRTELGWEEQDVVLAYSGSTAGWQSFSLLEELLAPLLERDPRVRVLFLSRHDPHVEALAQRHPGRIAQRWVRHDEVRATLMSCDHGLLVREDTITNQVASPTKFAEYLSAGLPVIISGGIGDFPAMVGSEDLGVVYRSGQPLPPLVRPDPLQRRRLMNFAQRQFAKSTYDAAYRALLEELA
jgi:hypothetical protein